jgi:TatD DNase family protein
MLIDTHAHINFNAYKSDADKVINRCLENNIWMINIGTNFETSKKAVEIAQKHEKGVFAAIGLHPINLDTGLVKIKVDESEGSHFEKEFDFEKYKELAKSQKVVAIGEIGLDYYWKPKTKRKLELFKEKQKDLLLKQLELAKELNLPPHQKFGSGGLPVIFHCRMAHQDLIKILAYDFNDRSNYMQGVMHGFFGTLDQLKEYLKMGFYIGFNGIIFKKIEGINFGEVIKETPIEKILIETDCPYLAPPISVNQRTYQRKSASTIRNEPLNVKYVAEEIAKIKNLSFEKVAEITTKNAKDLFKL